MADWTAKTVEKESTAAFNDLVKRATGGLLLKDLVPTNPAGAPLASLAGAGPGAAAAGALVTSDVAARAHAAAAALGLAPAVPSMIGGGALVGVGGVPSAEAAMLAARRAAEALRLAGHATATHFSEEVTTPHPRQFLPPPYPVRVPRSFYECCGSGVCRGTRVCQGSGVRKRPVGSFGAGRGGSENLNMDADTVVSKERKNSRASWQKLLMFVHVSLPNHLDPTHPPHPTPLLFFSRCSLLVSMIASVTLPPLFSLSCVVAACVLSWS